MAAGCVRHYACLMAAMALACSVSARGNEKDELLQVWECLKQATVRTEVNLNSGVYTEKAVVNVPLSIQIPWGYDQGSYGECLARWNLVSDVSKAAYLEAVDACRRESKSSGVPHIGEPGASIRMPASHDERVVGECVRDRLGIDVEVQIPDAAR